MQKQVITASNVRFSATSVGSIKFVATPRGTVKCIARNAAGKLPMIIVKQDPETGRFTASTRNGSCLATAANPKLAFRRAAKAWK